ncbi:hypothetical protein PGTUg99_028790 [Puccinia graminis f. sp. tritici]|uniref:Uncharacterized protein n=1 Tax=Puccinia graminis f. sp. tritici TaxID=56615 RepID=A0A5B0NX80_PUCGR|nr:hypothetical protein PGTUg99_028790 [Puccinia graminis f. sp. tritici]
MAVPQGKSSLSTVAGRISLVGEAWSASRAIELPAPSGNAPSISTQAAPSGNAPSAPTTSTQSGTAPVIPLTKAVAKSTQDGEHNSTAQSGVDEQPESPDARDDVFLDLLTQAPELSKQSRENVINNTNAVPDITVNESKERAHIWAKAREFQAAGDDVLSRVLLKAYGEFTTPAKPPTMRSVSAHPVLLTTQPTRVVSTETEIEDDLVYAIGTVTNHQDIGFTPFFDENIKKLKAPLPLTIFDREWQKEALAAHLTTRPSKSSEDKAYRGLPFYNEWTQTHSKWTNNHRIFHLTLRDVYHKTCFAEKLLIHKRNCDEISDEFGFMTAFRYDMQVQANAFAHRVQSKDGAAVPDISVKQNLVAERCYNEVHSAGETKWTDNYYAPGGSHDGIDPDTGRERPPLRLVSHNGYGGRDRGQQGRAEDHHSRPFDNN